MKNVFSLILGFCALLPAAGHGKILPLTQNSWDNPQFVDRFLGTYGIDSKKEPQITEEESQVLLQIIEAAQAEDYLGSLNILKESGIKADNSHSPAFDFIAANLNFQLGNLDEAVADYKRAIERFPEFRRAYENLGRLSLQRGEYAEAVTYITAAMELGSTSSDLFGLLAFCYLNAGNPTSALDAYRLASALDPENKDWKVGKAQALLLTEQFALAIGGLGRRDIRKAKRLAGAVEKHRPHPRHPPSFSFRNASARPRPSGAMPWRTDCGDGPKRAIMVRCSAMDRDRLG